MPKSFNIRVAVPNDAASACNVLRRSIVELCQLDYEGVPDRLNQWLANKTPETVRSWIMEGKISMFVTEHGRELSGVAGMASDLVLLNYVHPDWRFEGVSSALLAHMETLAKAAGVQEMRLQSSKTALRFYQSRGYEADPDKTERDEHWLIKDLSQYLHEAETR